MKIHNIQARDSNSYERKNKKISQEEQTLYDYVSKIYDGEVIQSNRSILKGKELALEASVFDNATKLVAPKLL